MCCAPAERGRFPWENCVHLIFKCRRNDTALDSCTKYISFQIWRKNGGKKIKQTQRSWSCKVVSSKKSRPPHNCYKVIRNRKLSFSLRSSTQKSLLRKHILVRWKQPSKRISGIIRQQRIPDVLLSLSLSLSFPSLGRVIFPLFPSSVLHFLHNSFFRNHISTSVGNRRPTQTSYDVFQACLRCVVCGNAVGQHSILVWLASGVDVHIRCHISLPGESFRSNTLAFYYTRSGIWTTENGFSSILPRKHSIQWAACVCCGVLCTQSNSLYCILWLWPKSECLWSVPHEETRFELNIGRNILNYYFNGSIDLIVRSWNPSAQSESANGIYRLCFVWENTLVDGTQWKMLSSSWFPESVKRYLKHLSNPQKVISSVPTWLWLFKLYGGRHFHSFLLSKVIPPFEASSCIAKSLCVCRVKWQSTIWSQKIPLST